MTKILLVEDEEILQKMYKSKFIKEGFEVLTARNGEEGVFLAQKEMPDFILLDLMMPKLDGVAALKLLKSLPSTKDIPVAVLSVVPQNDILVESDSDVFSDVVAYWRKDSFSPSQIVEKVEEILKRTEEGKK